MMRGGLSRAADQGRLSDYPGYVDGQQATTSITDSRRCVTSDNRLRGYFSASGKFQFDPQRSLSGSLRYVSDRTFLNRYDISHEDRLRSTHRTSTGSATTRSIFPSPAGISSRCAPTDPSRASCRSRLPAIDYRLRTPGAAARRHVPVPGEQPRHPAHRGPGYPARLRWRHLDAAAA